LRFDPLGQLDTQSRTVLPHRTHCSTIAAEQQYERAGSPVDIHPR
jgi:hypothetical protein